MLKCLVGLVPIYLTCLCNLHYGILFIRRDLNAIFQSRFYGCSTYAQLRIDTINYKSFVSVVELLLSICWLLGLELSSTALLRTAGITNTLILLSSHLPSSRDASEETTSKRTTKQKYKESNDTTLWHYAMHGLKPGEKWTQEDSRFSKCGHRIEWR